MTTRTVPVWENPAGVEGREATEEEVRAALARHGYDPDLPPRGVTGPPERVRVSYAAQPPPGGGWRGWPYLRNHVCVLDGIEVDGHERSDLWPGDPECLHCRYGHGDEPDPPAPTPAPAPAPLPAPVPALDAVPYTRPWTDTAAGITSGTLAATAHPCGHRAYFFTTTHDVEETLDGGLLPTRCDIRGRTTTAHPCGHPLTSITVAPAGPGDEPGTITQTCGDGDHQPCPGRSAAPGEPTRRCVCPCHTPLTGRTGQ